MNEATSLLSTRKTLTRSFSDSTLFSEKEAFRFKLNRQFNLKSSDFTTNNGHGLHENVTKGPCQARLIKYKYPILTLPPHKNEKILIQEKSDRERQEKPKFVKSNENSINTMQQMSKSKILTDKKSYLNVLSTPLSMCSLKIANELKASKNETNNGGVKNVTNKFRRSSNNKENENKESYAILAKKESNYKPDLINKLLIKHKIQDCHVQLKRLDSTQLTMISKFKKRSDKFSKISRVAE